MNSLLYVLLLAAAPISEVRGAIPAGIALGIPLWEVFLVATLANILIIPTLFALLRVSKLRSLVFKILGQRIQGKIDKNKEKFEKYGEFALAIFVGIPLPFTGVYTGVLIAEFLGWNRLKSSIAISLGVLIAAAIVLLASAGVFSLI